MRDLMSEPNEQDYADQANPPMTAKREWVEWRLVYANGKISSLAYFSEEDAKEYVKLFGVLTIIKTRVTVIE